MQSTSDHYQGTQTIYLIWLPSVLQCSSTKTTSTRKMKSSMMGSSISCNLACKPPSQSRGRLKLWYPPLIARIELELCTKSKTVIMSVSRYRMCWETLAAWNSIRISRHLRFRTHCTGEYKQIKRRKGNSTIMQELSMDRAIWRQRMVSLFNRVNTAIMHRN